MPRYARERGESRARFGVARIEAGGVDDRQRAFGCSVKDVFANVFGGFGDFRGGAHMLGECFEPGHGARAHRVGGDQIRGAAGQPCMGCDLRGDRRFAAAGRTGEQEGGLRP